MRFPAWRLSSRRSRARSRHGPRPARPQAPVRASATPPARSCVGVQGRCPAPPTSGDLCGRLYPARPTARRSEEHTSELQSLMRISYAVFCLKKKKKTTNTDAKTISHKKTTKIHKTTTEYTIQQKIKT